MSELNHPNEINRDYIRLLQAMSRFIKEEFTVAIRMTQEDAIEQLLHYAEQSRNSVLQEMGKELRELSYGPQVEEAESTTEEPQNVTEEGVRYYRGAPVAGSGQPAIKEEPDKTQAPAETEAPRKSKATRVYRGQVISS